MKIPSYVNHSVSKDDRHLIQKERYLMSMKAQV